MDVLSYEPGNLPTQEAPKPGDSISIHVDGFPPYKDNHFSIRNRKHPKHSRFLALREKSYEAMKGRAWYSGPVGLRIEYKSSNMGDWEEWVGYLGGIMDTIDGSSGFTFTFLPAVIEDDSQVVRISGEFVFASHPGYVVSVDFLDDSEHWKNR